MNILICCGFLVELVADLSMCIRQILCKSNSIVCFCTCAICTLVIYCVIMISYLYIATVHCCFVYLMGTLIEINFY